MPYDAPRCQRDGAGAAGGGTSTFVVVVTGGVATSGGGFVSTGGGGCGVAARALARSSLILTITASASPAVSARSVR